MNGHSSHQMKGGKLLTLYETNNEPTFRLHIKLTKNRKKKFEKLLMAQICLIKIMSQLLDYTKKMAKNRGKNSKIIFCSDLSETNNDPTF